MSQPLSNVAVILTSYKPTTLGKPGYSHSLVAELFRPLLARCVAEVHAVPGTVDDVERRAADCRLRGRQPIHVSVTPLQDMPVARGVPNVAMPAWEFPDVPDHAFDDNPQNDWVETANRCDLVIVGGRFTERALRMAGVRTPIWLVPVPTPDAYFALPDRGRGEPVRLEECDHYDFRHGDVPALPIRSAAGVPGHRPFRDVGFRLARQVFRGVVRPLVGWRLARSFFEGVRSARTIYQAGAAVLPPRRDELLLDGVVFSSVFNPGDGRKNWQDLISAGLAALADEPGATLVAKLVTSDPEPIERVISWYLGRGFWHRCRLVFVTGRLSDAGMVDLVRASDFYVQATRAEGNCLPLMNALAAGRPAITPSHTAIADYFDESIGFPVDWHAEPAAWPHDARLRFRTTWARIVWPSLVERIRASYRLRVEQPADYAAMAARARARMTGWSDRETVLRSLAGSLELLATPRVIKAERRAAA